MTTKLIRETTRTIRGVGGTHVWLEDRGKHIWVHCKINGRPYVFTTSKGANVGIGAAHRLKDQILKASMEQPA